ncbi:hypothetical protein OS42_03570 [Dickeya oryzae]
MLRIRSHVADVHLLTGQYIAQEVTKCIVTDTADKAAVAAQSGNAYGNIGRGTTRAFQIAVFAFWNEIDHCITHYPYFVRHSYTLSRGLLNC